MTQTSEAEAVKAWMTAHNFIYRSDNFDDIGWLRDEIFIPEEAATFFYKAVKQLELEVRKDELARIPVIETKGVGYEVIVSHRMERLRWLSDEAAELQRLQKGGV